MSVFFRKRIRSVRSVAVKFMLMATFLSGHSLLSTGQPSASFTSNVFTGCAPLTVNFTNLSTQATNYVWNFGNGNTSTLQDPTTVYLSSGFYTVTLVAINSLTGMRDTLVATNYINVVSNPVADFAAAPLTACLNENLISFTNMSINANQYTWDFGDGNTSTQQNPVHGYTAPGTYTVKLIARNPWGCQDIIVKQGYVSILPNPAGQAWSSPRSSCDPNQVFTFNCNAPNVLSYEWDFGDGNTSTLPNPTHVYGTTGTWTISLIMTAPNGCTDTIVNVNHINIGNNLVPSFNVNTQSGCPPLNVNFNSTVQNATTWLWDFGDGTTSILENPVHVFNNPGSYDITLTVTTSTGCNGTVTLPGHIVVDDIPQVSFNVVNPSGCYPFNTLFNNTSTGASTYLWDFGDGFTSSQFNPVHSYGTTGTYDVTLTATSSNGCQADSTINAAVSVNTIDASFNGTPRVGCPPLPVTLNGSSAPPAAFWIWDLGDGNTGNTQTLGHTYNAVGNYNITLVAISPEGCRDTVVKNNFFRVVDGSVNYTVPDTIQVCTPPGTVAFSDPTFGSNYWSWHFGDGDSSNTKNPTHIYSNPGIYTVTLTTSMAGGCVQVYNPYAIIEVTPFDVSPINSIILSNCQPYIVQFDDTTANVGSYLWDFGDGTTDTTKSPQHTYAQPGTYSISLQITSVNGCMSNLNTTVTFGHQNPIVVSSDSNCTGDTVFFSLNNNAFVSALWDFGDGATSNILQPGHVYQNAGSYNVSVILTDSTSCIDTFYFAPVLVGDPQPSFYTNDPREGCVTLRVKFTNTSTGATSYLWDFGIGPTKTVTNPSKSYGVPGTYSVTLTASANGCSRSVTYVDYITVNGAFANFNFTQDQDCLPITATFNDLSIDPVSWLWDFGDGNTSTLQNPVHVFNTLPAGPVSLMIVDSNGCSDIQTKANISYVIAQIGANDTSGCRPHNVTFSSPTNAVSYLWDFGDGTTGTGQNVNHLYLDTGTFDVTLACILASGCTTSITLSNHIEVIAPEADFNVPNQPACAPSVVDFMNLSSPGSVSFLWDFGDGSTSSNSNPSNIYAAAGSYTVSLIATDTLGCSDTIVKPDYVVIPGPVSLFTLASQQSCQSTFVQFTDLSTNASGWSWNFGDGYTSTLQNPSHTYQDTGSFIVSLITTDSSGCSSLYVSPNPIIVYPKPDASGSVNATSGCHPVSLIFSNSSSGATGYIWQFGNGDSSDLQNPVYTYVDPGTYSAYLVAVNQYGCTDTSYLNDSIRIYTQPVADFSTSTTNGCSPLVVSFNNTSTDTVAAVFYWDFGNGQTSTAKDPSVTFVNTGTFDVLLVVTNQSGCTDSITKQITVLPSPVASGMVSSTSGCTPLNVSFTDLSTSAFSWYWDFGDGNSSTLQNPSHTYSVSGSFDITLTITSQNGCTDTFALPAPITVGLTPVASFTASPATGCVPFNVNLANTSTSLDSASYQWSFGNGQTSVQQSPSVIYYMQNNFIISLTVTNAGGCSDSSQIQVQSWHQAVAAATVIDTSGCLPHTVNFNNNSQNATGYLWDFGDGNTSSDTVPVHVYQQPGVYNITLTAFGQGGCSDTVVLAQQVTVYPNPTASFTATPDGLCTPVNVQLKNNSASGPNAVFQWDLGDGSTSNLFEPSIQYINGGSYQIILSVTDEGGCTDSDSTLIIAGQSPTAMAAPVDTTGCAPMTVTFNNFSVNSDIYEWQFGDGQSSTLQNATHSYTQPGQYVPVLIATNISGCTDTLELPVMNVNTTPSAAFSVADRNICPGESFYFINQTTPATGVSYIWNIGGNTYTTTEPVVQLHDAGFYDVQLIAIHTDGCSDTLDQPFYLQVYDTLPPVASPIRSVSVADNFTVEIVWENNASLDLGEYRLFRLNQQTGLYELIYTDFTPANSSMSVTSSYTDIGLNTLINTYTYKLQTVDVCENALDLWYSVPHTTINVTAVPLAGNIRVDWSPYQGCIISGYEIHRTEVSTGVSSLVASVLPGTLSYTDTGFYCPDEFSYRITATDLCGRGYLSLSDTSVAVPANTLTSQVVEVVRSTVVNDRDVLTEWLPPVLAPDRVFGYEILRSANGGPFDLVASLSPLDYSFLDRDVDVHNNRYRYRVAVLNDCNLTGPISNNGSSILLRSEALDQQDKLWWTEYSGWDDGVDFYIIEEQDEFGNWNQVKTVNGNKNETIIK